ncbi:MAG: hypothetical protein NVS9B1_02940 [Candidatus Dormibacteraceae bacterium]
MATATKSSRRVKVRGGHLGPFLCWAVVFADIGTSIYYTPGILYGQVGSRSALFVAMTLLVFILLTIKYAEVAWRYPEGGGVVTVASRAIHPYAGLVGGLLILVDYFLTAALSALSGVLYLGVVAPVLSLPAVSVAVTIAALVGLGTLNAIGIKESARVSAVFAVAAATTQLVVVILVALSLGPDGIARTFHAITAGPRLGPIGLVTGYAAAFLAFSGLESIAQIAPAMREPRRAVAYRAMGAVVITMVITSPLLTLWSTTLLDKGADPNQFISLLGAHVAGPVMGAAVAVCGALLLVLAANTAIIGSYHVFIALARMGFLPRPLEHRNRWRRTPHWAILVSVLIPVLVVFVAGANPNLLGDLYAFGLLGAFVLTCFALDLVRWREQATRHGLRQRAGYGLGVLTTLLVIVAWVTNLVNKPLATAFGGGLTAIGLVIGFTTYRRASGRRPSVFPVPFEPARAAASIAEALQGRPAELLVIIPHDPEVAEAVLREACGRAGDSRVLFLYRGSQPSHVAPTTEFMEVADPYLKDFHAQDAFARAESMTRATISDRRYVYVPGNLRRELIGDIWKRIHPMETMVAEGDQEHLPPLAIERVRRHVTDGVPVIHLFTVRPHRPPLEVLPRDRERTG